MKYLVLLTYFLPQGAELETILFILIFTFLFFAIVFFAAIMIYRTAKTIDIRFIDSVRNMYHDLFISAAFSENIELSEVVQKTKALNKKYLRKKKYARIITEELLNLSKSFTGDSKINLRELYMKSGFVEYSENKIKSRRWDIQAQGLREVAEMKDERILPVLRKLSKKKNKLIRENAQLSLLKINGFNELNFLDYTDTRISDWHQINLIEALKEYNKSALPDFTVWLNSNEITVILFAVRLISYFKQMDKSSKLLNLLDYKDKRVKMEVIRTLAAFNKTEALPYLEKMYDQESVEIKLEIIKAYALLTEYNAAGILIKWLIQSADSEIQKTCLEAIISVNATDALRELVVKDEKLNFLISNLIEEAQK